MPELPDLEAIVSVLRQRVVGRLVEVAEVLRPLVVRDLTLVGFEAQVAGRRLTSVARRGKFLLLGLEGGLTLVINPMLVGRLYLVPSPERRLASTHLILHLEGGEDLRYVDTRTMGKVYLTDDLDRVPGYEEMGPDALPVRRGSPWPATGTDGDPALTLEEFARRLRRHNGEIKGILCNSRFVAGIGNAYADEILWHARIYPFRKRSTLTDDEIARLYQAIPEVLNQAIEVVRDQMGEEVDRKIRDFLAVHNKGGEPCPRCGTPISQLTARQRITSFCRVCQPGTLVETWRQEVALKRQ